MFDPIGKILGHDVKKPFGMKGGKMYVDRHSLNMTQAQFERLMDVAKDVKKEVPGAKIVVTPYTRKESKFPSKTGQTMAVRFNMPVGTSPETLEKFRKAVHGQYQKHLKKSMIVTEVTNPRVRSETSPGGPAV